MFQRWARSLLILNIYLIQHIHATGSFLMI